MSQERTEGGHFTAKYTNEDVLGAFSEAGVPVLTSREVSEFVGCSVGTARNRLEGLVEDEKLIRKKVGARAVVYIRLRTEVNRRSGYGEWKQELWDSDSEE